MTYGVVAAVGGTIVGGAIQSRGARKAAEAQERAAQAGISEQEAARLAFEERTQPFADIGLAAGDPLLELLGLPSQAAGQGIQLDSDIASTQAQIADLNQQIAGVPAGSSFLGKGVGDARRLDLNTRLEGLQGDLDRLQGERAALPEIQPQPAGNQLSQLEQINPIVSFLQEQGFRDIQESAAGRGKLVSGGTDRDLTRFQTGLTSTIVPQLQQQRFNQLFNVLGLGANTAAGQGTAGLQTAGNIANLQGNIGAAQAQGAINQSNALTQGISNIGSALGAFPQTQNPVFGGGAQFTPTAGSQSLGVQSNALGTPLFQQSAGQQPSVLGSF
jgi:hypothetical protein